MGVKVAKFGGSSVADALQIEKIRNIIENDEDIKYVVVSAPGKSPIFCIFARPISSIKFLMNRYSR